MTNNPSNQPLDPDAIRRTHLEDNIRDALAQIKEFEDKRRNSDNPNEVARCKKALLELRQQLQEYQREYAELTGGHTSGGAKLAVPEPFPEAWIVQLAHPVAVPCTLYNQAQDITARFLALDHLLTSVVKYLAAIALAQYRKDNPHSPQLRPWLQRLSRRHLSEWVILLDEIDAYYDQDIDERPVFLTLLFDAYHRSLTQGSPAEQAYRELCQSLQSDLVGQPRVADLMRAVVTYRQRTWEVGPGRLSPDFVASWEALLRPAFRDLLDAFSLVRDYPLRYAEHARLA